MDILEQHRRAMDEFDRRVQAITPDQWDAPTPCEDWDVRALVNHLVYEQRWAAALLGGERIEEVGDRFDGDQLGADPKRAWTESAGRARAAWTQDGALDGTVTLSFGTVPVAVYAMQATTDLAVHAWDLARGIGADDRIDPELAAALHAANADQAEAIAASGLFADPIDVPADADPQTRLLALLGRDAR